LHHLFLERRIDTTALNFHFSQQRLRIVRVLQQPTPQVATLEMSVDIKRMHNPQLIARTTHRDVITFLEQVFRPSVQHSQLSVVWRPIYHRKKYNIAFVPLKLRCIAAEKSVSGKDIRR